MRPRRHGAFLCGPSTSPLEVAPRIDLQMRHEIEEPTPRPFVMGNLVRARGTSTIHFGDGVLVARLCLGGRARTVASMEAPSNNRWRARAAGLVELADMSMISIKCLRLAPQRPRGPQLPR